MLAKQERKLDLEIQSLEKKNKWDIRAQFMSPIIATLVGLLGLSLTVCQFRSQRTSEQSRSITEQRKDRANRETDQKARLLSQIRADVDEILHFTHDEKQTVSRLSFLLEDIRTVLNTEVKETKVGSDDSETKKLGEINRDYERNVTDSLIVLIKEDCDFSKNPRDVRLTNTVIRHWSDYSTYFEETPKQLEWILFQYTSALRSFRDANPGYLQGMTVPDGYEPSPRYKNRKDAAILYTRMIDLTDGFMEHVEILGKANKSQEATELRQKYLEKFEGALCNPALSKDMLGADFTEQPCDR